MSLLVDWEIRKLCQGGMIQPFDEELLNPASLDVRLGDTVGILKPAWDYIDPLDSSSYDFEYTKIGPGGYVLAPGEFILGCLLEQVKIPPNVAAEVCGKSSLGRIGLQNSAVAGFIDPGFGLPSYVTIELYNQGAYPIVLHAAQKIGQLVFYKTALCQHPYGSKGNSYQSQGKAQGKK